MTDAGQFEAFVRQYQRMVFATAVRLLGNAADAEDAAQTVFLRAFERFEMIGPSPTAAGWLRKVTTNVCLDHLSRYRRRWRFFSEMGRGDPAEGAYEEGTGSGNRARGRASGRSRAGLAVPAVRAARPSRPVPLRGP
jgi:RNA polymerase sigma factor (sigma-70 family)